MAADESEVALRTAGLAGESFPALTIAFQRTLRIPAAGRTRCPPASARSLDDFPATAPASWLQRGGVVLPMDQSEALCISFSARVPCAARNARRSSGFFAELRTYPTAEGVCQSRDDHGRDVEVGLFG